MGELAQNALEIVGITKRFPGILANDNVSLTLKKGEVLGLLGENGAGKSTLMNILYGLHQPDQGKILVYGKETKITSPNVAVKNNIGMVHQHFMLVDNLTALENTLLGLEQQRAPFLDKDLTFKKFKKITEEYDLNLDPNTPVWQLTVGEQQWLEIIKLLLRNAKIIILDEPTAVLAPAQADQLFQTMRRFVSEGKSIIFISHKLEEVKKVTDRITVLRDGKVIDTVLTSQTTPASLAEMMVGRKVTLDRRLRKKSAQQKAVLKMDDVSCLNDRGVKALDHINMSVYSGEIVGIAGVDGNGQKELAEVIAGLRPTLNGSVAIGDVKVKNVVKKPSLLGYIPEDRLKTGLIAGFNIAENLSIKNFDRKPFCKGTFLQWKTIMSAAEELIHKFGVKTSSVNTDITTLSGGNQQKVILARELSNDPQLIVASQPTRGLDMGAVEGVHEALLRERDRGAGILFISTELAEVLSLCDRIFVFQKGKIMGEIDGDQADVNQIGQLMLGHRVNEDSL